MQVCQACIMGLEINWFLLLFTCCSVWMCIIITRKMWWRWTEDRTKPDSLRSGLKPIRFGFEPEIRFEIFFENSCLFMIISSILLALFGKYLILMMLCWTMVTYLRGCESIFSQLRLHSVATVCVLNGQCTSLLELVFHPLVARLVFKVMG